jgi:D-3-phosphoglycerate dehydrogenase
VRCAVDVRNVDVAAASRAGVLATRASAGFVPAVAELILGFMIDLARGITRATTDYRAGRAPTVEVGRQLHGATLGVIGHGAIGRRLAGLGLALGMRVLVADPHVDAVAEGLERVRLDELLARADFVVCLAIATDATENLMNADAFARMKPTAYFVNASRGGLVDEAALAAALDRRQIAGAALDVGRAPDQMPSPALAARADVIATPHVGGLTPEAASHQAFETVRQVAEIVSGRAPPGSLNAERATRLARFAAPAR